MYKVADNGNLYSCAELNVAEVCNRCDTFESTYGTIALIRTQNKFIVNYYQCRINEKNVATG